MSVTVAPGVLRTVRLPVVKCLRCGAEYVARTEYLPKTCAKCRSKVWMKPKTNKRRKK